MADPTLLFLFGTPSISLCCCIDTKIRMEARGGQGKGTDGGGGCRTC